MIIEVTKREKSQKGGGSTSRHSDMDNHANQMNPNNDAYWDSRGYDERPDDWEERAGDDKDKPQEDRRQILNKAHTRIF